MGDSAGPHPSQLAWPGLGMLTQHTCASNPERVAHAVAPLAITHHQAEARLERRLVAWVARGHGAGCTVQRGVGGGRAAWSNKLRGCVLAAAAAVPVDVRRLMCVAGPPAADDAPPPLLWLGVM